MAKNEEIVAHVLSVVTTRLQQLATALDNQARFECSAASKKTDEFARGYALGLAQGNRDAADEVRRVIEELQRANG